MLNEDFGVGSMACLLLFWKWCMLCIEIPHFT